MVTYSALLMLLLSACSMQRAESADALSVTEDADEAAEVKSGFTASAAAIDGFIDQTRHGRNLSEMTVGLFVSSLLGQLGSQDTALSAHLHQGGRFIDGYLSEIFQYHPKDEIAHILSLPQPGNLLVRQIAAAALECLLHIPDSKTVQAEQATDREALATSFADLKRQLGLLISSLP